MLNRVPILLAFLLPLPATADPAVPPTYFGLHAIYAKDEIHSDRGDARVTLLTPTGTDILPSASRAALIEGQMTEASAEKLDRLLRDNADITTLYMDSEGGEFIAATQIGTAILRAQLQTVVGAGAKCYSACALAFLAGTTRVIAADDGAFGVHRPYYQHDGSIQYRQIEADVADVSAYLERIGITQIAADEVVGSTGMATYTQQRLLERGLIHASAMDIQQFNADQIYQAGVSPYELYAAACWMFEEDVKAHCTRMPVITRLPMLRTYFSRNPLPDSYREQLLVTIEAGNAAYSHDDVLSMNCRLGREQFISHVERRMDQIRAWIPEPRVVQVLEGRAREIRQRCQSEVSAAGGA